MLIFMRTLNQNFCENCQDTATKDFEEHVSVCEHCFTELNSLFDRVEEDEAIELPEEAPVSMYHAEMLVAA